MSAGNAKLSRRSFLLAVGAGGAAGAAALVAKTAPPAAPATGVNDKKKTKGYQASAHVRNYYRTAKV